MSASSSPDDDARRLLNRAVATSARDPAFMAEARRLASSHPETLLQRMLTAASLDVLQAELMHKLLCGLPELAAHATPAGELVLHQWLRGALAEPALPPTRQRALLLLLARLTHPAEDPTVAPARRDLALEDVGRSSRTHRTAGHCATLHSAGTPPPLTWSAHGSSPRGASRCRPIHGYAKY